MSYAEQEAKAVSALKKAIPPELKKDMIKESKGLSAEIFKNDEIFPNHYLACAIDSAGTKVMIAELMEKYDTIGQDAVAMSANDLATFGNMSPFIFMDCLSTQNEIQKKTITADIIKGISHALKMCDASKVFKNSISLNFGKGETASVHELLDSPRPGYGFDLVGSMIGFIPREKFHLEVYDGDVIIALPSSGPHCNGYTELRHQLLNGDFETREQYKKNYKGKHTLKDTYEGKTIGEMLLEPTKLYVQDMAKISKEHDVVGVNNTGYGLKNLNRVQGNFKFIVDNPIKPNPIFNLMQQESGFTDEHMYTSFNMGQGFFVIARKEHAGSIQQLIKDAQVIGHVEKGKKATVLRKDGKEIVFEGY